MRSWWPVWKTYFNVILKHIYWDQQCVSDMSVLIWMGHSSTKLHVFKDLYGFYTIGVIYYYCKSNLIQRRLKNLVHSIWDSVKDFLRESQVGYFKSVSTHSYSPQVNTSDWQQMNELSWGLRGDFCDQSTLIGQWINQSSPWGEGKSNSGKSVDVFCLG